MLVVSTVGRLKRGPLWTIKTLAESGDPSVFWRHSSINRSPKVTQAFLDRQRRVLVPAQFAREHRNQWIDGADALTTQADVDFAMSGHGAVYLAASESRVIFVDIGLVSDPTVIAEAGRLDDGRLIVTNLWTFQGNHEQPVKLADVEAKIRDTCAARHITQIRVESWQGVQAVQSLAASGLPAEIFTPTSKRHAEEWPVLVQQLSTHRLVLPNHARLREELLNLVVEVGPTGIRVIDRGHVHQDHAVAVRGVVAMLAQDEEIPLMVVGGSAYQEWLAKHPERVMAEPVDAGEQWEYLTVEDETEAQRLIEEEGWEPA
jgi:hypothetical protein